MVDTFLLRQFGAQIRALRLKKNFSQEELAYKTGLHRTYIGMIERGERNITLSNIALFASVFDLSLSQLFEWDPTAVQPSSSSSRRKAKKLPSPF